MSFLSRWFVQPETVPLRIAPEMLTWRETITSVPRTITEENPWFWTAFSISEQNFPNEENQYLYKISIRIQPKRDTPDSFISYKWLSIGFDIPEISNQQKLSLHPVIGNPMVIRIDQNQKPIAQAEIKSLDLNDIHGIE